MNNQSEITENRQTVDSQTSSDHKVGLATAEKQTEASYNHRHRKSAPTSVATAVFLSLDLGFFHSGQFLEMSVVLLYFPFKNTVVSQA